MLDITLKIGKNRHVNLKHRRKNMIIDTGLELKEFRRINGLSQNQLAKIIGCQKTAIYNVEHKHPTRQLPKWLKEKISNNESMDEFVSPYQEEKKFKLWEWLMSFIKK